jgi:hypothetical protein
VLRAALIAALAAAAAACTDDAAAPARRVAPPAVAPAAAVAAAEDPGDRWDRATAALEARRTELADRYARARAADARAVVLADASAAFLDAVDDLVAPWMGTPWGLGTNSTARRPHEPGMTVGCSYFVTSILQGAGVALDNRYHFAQAAALHIQRSLVGAGRAGIHRFLSIPPAELAPKIAALGDGLYLIGLSNHVGFVIVRGAGVRFVHASYTNDRAVSDEPLATAAAIAASQPSGYFVSPLVTRAGTADDWLVDRWLRGATITFDPSR